MALRICRIAAGGHSPDLCHASDVDSQQSTDRPRAFVPLDLLTSMRAPFGWTNRTRRQEGYPAIGERRSIHIGFWRSLGLAVLVYGPPAVGAWIGFHVGREWGWALVGGIGGFGVQIFAWLASAPVVGLLTHRRS